MPNSSIARLKKLCESLPGAVEEFPWDHSVFKVAKKMFALFNEENARVTVKTTYEKKTVLEQDPSVHHAPYLGNKGWVSVEITPETMDLAEELIKESYNLVVATLPKKAQKNLDL